MPSLPVAPVNPARLAAASGTDGVGVDGAILRSAAHLRIEGVPGGPGELELHLRVRGEVTHLRIEGIGAQALGMREPELASALATAGLSLGRLDLPPVASASGPQMSGGGSHRPGTDAGSGGSSHTPSQGQPEPRDRGSAPHAPEPRNETTRGGRATARGARVHVEA